MKIQTLSIVVPTNGCVNKCPFCVSRMHENPSSEEINWVQYKKRLIFAHNNGVNTLVITGTGEPFQNMTFIRRLDAELANMPGMFPNREIQTTGVFLAEKFKGNFIMLGAKGLDISTISLSVSNIFDSNTNWDLQGTPQNLRTPLETLCYEIIKRGFNLRLSLNLTDTYETGEPYSKETKNFIKKILIRCKELGAHQVIFRKMYYNNDDTIQSKWVKKHSINESVLSNIKKHIQEKGQKLYTLPFGTDVYSIDGMSTVIDNDCMSKESDDSLKYVILRENGKLYCRWDDEGSLIF